MREGEGEAGEARRASTLARLSLQGEAKEEANSLEGLSEVGLDVGCLSVVAVTDLVLPEKLGSVVRERLSGEVGLDERRSDLMKEGRRSV